MLKLETNLCENKLSLIGQLTLELKKKITTHLPYFYFFF